MGVTSMPQKREHDSLERYMGCLAIALFIVQNDNLKLFSGNFVSRKNDALDIRDIAGDRMQITKTVL